MTAPRLPDRDATQVDALVADRYLDALLEAGDRRADDAPSDAALDPELRRAARALGVDVRVPPAADLPDATLRELGQELGPPWTQEHRAATATGFALLAALRTTSGPE